MGCSRSGVGDGGFLCAKWYKFFISSGTVIKHLWEFSDSGFLFLFCQSWDFFAGLKTISKMMFVDEGLSLDDGDDEISEEDLARLEQELAEALEP